MNIVLGQKVRDLISGFTGITVARLERLGEQDRFEVQPLTVDGKLPSSEWFTLDRLEVVHSAQKISPQPPAPVVPKKTPKRK